MHCYFGVLLLSFFAVGCLKMQIETHPKMPSNDHDGYCIPASGDVNRLTVMEDSKNDDLSYGCGICAQFFAHPEGAVSCFNGHASGRTSEQSRLRVAACTVCDATFRTEWMLRAHMIRGNHRNCFPVMQGSKSSYRTDAVCIRNKNSPALESELSTVVFRQRKETKNFKQPQTGFARFTCKMCLRSFKRIDHLSNHMRIHTRLFTCSVCYAGLFSVTQLAIHMRLAHSV